MKYVTGCPLVFGVRFRANSGREYIIHPNAKVTVDNPLPLCHNHDTFLRHVHKWDVTRRGLFVVFLVDDQCSSGAMSSTWRPSDVRDGIVHKIHFTEVSTVDEGGCLAARWYDSNELRHAKPTPFPPFGTWDMFAVDAIKYEISKR